MLQIIADGAVDMPSEWKREYEIHVLPLNIRFGEQTYTQFHDITQEDFYRLVQEKRLIP